MHRVITGFSKQLPTCSFKISMDRHITEKHLVYLPPYLYPYPYSSIPLPLVFPAFLHHSRVSSASSCVPFLASVFPPLISRPKSAVTSTMRPKDPACCVTRSESSSPRARQISSRGASAVSSPTPTAPSTPRRTSR